MVTKKYSGRNGSFGVTSRSKGAIGPTLNKNKPYGTGEKTTVRSGAKSSKSFLSLSNMADGAKHYSNTKKPKGKKK